MAFRGVTRDGVIDGLCFPLLEGLELRYDLTVKFFFLSSSLILSSSVILMKAAGFF